MGTTVEGMAGHYRESVAMIEESDPDQEFAVALREELEALSSLAVPAGPA